MRDPLVLMGSSLIGGMHYIFNFKSIDHFDFDAAFCRNAAFVGHFYGLRIAQMYLKKKEKTANLAKSNILASEKYQCLVCTTSKNSMSKRWKPEKIRFI